MPDYRSIVRSINGLDYVSKLIYAKTAENGQTYFRKKLKPARCHEEV